MANKNENKQQEEFSSKISNEINCAICLDIMVSPRTLAPCGHSFCRSCCFSDSKKNGRRGQTQTLSFSTCPHCRQTIQDTAPSRQLENLINTLVTVPNLIFRNDDDKQHFLKRAKTEKERSRTLQVSARTTKKRRRPVDYLSSNYAAAVNPQMFQVPSNRYHPHHGGGVPFQPPSNFTTTTRPSSFDPMVAPLPPPYDFTATGPVPVLNFSRPMGSPDPSRSRSPQIERSGTGINGISATDPICID